MIQLTVCCLQILITLKLSTILKDYKGEWFNLHERTFSSINIKYIHYKS